MFIKRLLKVAIIHVILIIFCKCANSSGVGQPDNNEIKVANILQHLISVEQPVVPEYKESLHSLEGKPLISAVSSLPKIKANDVDGDRTHLASLDSSGNKNSARLTLKERKARQDKKKLQRNSQNNKKNPLANENISRFEAKHLYENGKLGVNSNSFENLCLSSDKARRYLVELNMKLYQGNVLPQTGGSNFDNWLTQGLESRFVTIIDQDITILTEDIRTQMEKWKADELKQNKELPKIRPDFKTSEEQIVTQISFHPIKDADGNIVSVDVKATKLQTHVRLGMDTYDENAKLSHLEGIDTGNAKHLEEKVIALFTVDELKTIATRTMSFWKRFKISRAFGRFNFDEENTLYKETKAEMFPEYEENGNGHKNTDESSHSNNNLPEEPDSDKENKGGSQNGNDGYSEHDGFCGGSRARRSISNGVGSGCAIYINKETNEVERIQADEFYEQYKNGDDEKKLRLIEIAKSNMDKIISEKGDLEMPGMLNEGQRNIETLVEIEDMKSHARGIEDVNEIQDLTRTKNVEPEILIENLKERLGNFRAKISNSKFVTAMATSKSLNSFSERVDKTSNVLGTFFLAKTVVNGIIHGDTTSLAIVGARVGYDVATQSAVWAGSTFFSTAGKVGTATELLSKCAGPIGAAADIGLSIWSLTKAIDRLKSATNQFERNDAIADIVEDSIDIAITYEVTVISIAFPELAPIAAAVGFLIDTFTKIAVALFKAGNEVNRIDKEIGLLEFEKEEVLYSRSMDWFGTRHKDYIDYLLEEKGANDMAVKHNLEFLRNNSKQFRGIVFPSRTLHYDGGCTLTNQYCTFKWLGCWKWEQEVTIGTGCDWNKPCPREDRPCSDYQIPLNHGYNQYTCKCNSGPKSSFDSFARKDQFVDFRQKNTVFWERAVPAEVKDGVFKCKPGSKQYLGYRTSQERSREEYLCENAIGLLQPKNKWTDKQALLVDLEDGKDTVYLDGKDNTSAIFRMGTCGNKKFVGSGGKNEFVFDAEVECDKFEATLVGGMQETDTITLMSTFGKGHNMRADFNEGYLKSTDSEKINISIENVEEITGRDGEMEEVIVGCSTKRVALRGGKINEPDKVVIPGSNDCEYGLTLVTSAYSNVDSKARKGDITLLIDDSFTSKIQASFDIYQNSTPTVNVIFIKTPSRQITHQTINVTAGQNLAIDINSLTGSNENATKIIFRGKNLPKEDFEKDLVFHFVESPAGAPYSILVVSAQIGRSSVVYHTLPPKQDNWKTDDMRRHGSVSFKNVFEIKGRDWISYGGNANDEFVLETIPLEIHGSDGDDTIKLHKDFEETLSLNLTSQNFTSIENVIGSLNKSLSVTCACDTKAVLVMGGPSLQTRNVVSIPEWQKCNKRPQPLQVVAKGYSRVEILGEVANFNEDGVVVTAMSSSKNKTNETNSEPLSFEFEGGLNNLGGLLLNLQLNHKNWTATTAKREGQHAVSMLLGMDQQYNLSETIYLKLATGDLSTDDTFVSNPFIQVVIQNSNEVSGQLVIEKDTGYPNVMYMLGENSSKIEGFRGIPNIFRVTNSSWDITGGDAADVFYVFSSAVNGTQINGGNGQNSLILETPYSHDEQQNKTFSVNLQKGQFGFIGTPKNERGKLTAIYHLVGRPSKPDMIYAACTTKSINGRGGLSNGQEDVIFISSINCTNKMDLTVDLRGNFTNVKNSASLGSFNYHVGDWMTIGLDLNVTDTNQHTLNFLFDPWAVVKNVVFKTDSNLLTFKLGNNGSLATKTQVFQMAGPSNDTSEFTNPIIRFHQPDSPITTDIRVASDTGIVAATILLRGRGLKKEEIILGLSVDINRFLINVTTQVESCGGVIRGNSKSQANQFWIFQLNSSLDLLDGGHMQVANVSIGSKNYLHFAESLFPNIDLEVDLDLENGFLRKTGSKNETLINNIQNIHELYGRNISTAKDTAYVTCNTRSIYQVENIFIRPLNQTHENEPTCLSVNMVIGLGNDTKVVFLGELEEPTLTNLTTTNVFHYIFTVPRSFDLETLEKNDDEVIMLMYTSTHNYYLPLKLDDLKTLAFDPNEERLSYSLYSTNSTYYHRMISSTIYSDQFYPQPVIVTQDGFMIQVARTGGILLSLGTSSSFPSLENVQSKVVPALEKTSQRLDVTIMVQTKNEFLYIGHDGNSSENRNVLENSEYLTSHLVGSGGNDTIYEISSLRHDVYIYSGFEHFPQLCSQCPKHTVELTDVVMAIRMNFGVKYVPSVYQVENDLVIFMKGHENEFPGKLVIQNGSLERVSGRFQFLLHSTMMDLTLENGTSNWKLSPRPIVVPQGYVYSIAASDLENGHDIQFDTAAVELNATTFTAAKNESDLYLSDIKALKTNNTTNLTSGFKETTTVIITDFYIDYHFKPKQNYSLTDFNDSSPYPTKVFEVKISLPGLDVLLNDTQVLENKQNKGIEEIRSFDVMKNVNPVEKAALKMTEAPVLEWKCVLHDVEEQILRDMQDIQRVYYRDECTDHYWTNIATLLGSFIGCVLVLILIVNRKLIRNMIGKVTEELEERQLIRSSQSGYKSI